MEKERFISIGAELLIVNRNQFAISVYKINCNCLFGIRERRVFIRKRCV